jgi:hypothetical protein
MKSSNKKTVLKIQINNAQTIFVIIRDIVEIVTIVIAESTFAK